MWDYRGMKNEKVATTSESIKNDNLQKLRSIFPQFVKDGEVDFDALQAFLKKDGILNEGEKYGLNWSGKSNAFRILRTPATGTLTPQVEESKNWDSTENIFIEGDNLEVLKLLQKHYREKIKMIYIDPPYNTGKDFIYKDNFTQDRADYYEQSGQTQDGIKMMKNTDKNGHYHSDWLTMMYPRLFLARNLLKDDGVIFISIDDHEVANLRLIMDEIFGEENFEGHIHWRRRHNQPNDPNKLIALVAEHILVYSKNSENLKKTGVGKLDLTGNFSNPDNDPKGDWNSKPWKIGSNQNGSKYTITLPSNRIIEGEWMGEENTYTQLLADGRIYFSKEGDGLPRKKIYKSEREKEGQSATNWFEHQIFGNNQEASNEISELFNNKNIFDNPKPTKLIKGLLRLGNLNDKEIVLDFFAGSGTTAHSVMEQNAEDGGDRKWICVQLPELTDEDSEAYKAGYKTIADISRERIRRVGRKIGDGKGDIGFKSYKLAPSNYRQWQSVTDEEGVKGFLNQSKLFLDNPLVDSYNQMSVISEILLKEGFDLNTTVISVDKKDTDLPWSYYIIADKSPEDTISKSIVVTFAEKILQKDLENPKIKAVDLFVCFDSAVDDTAKINIGRSINLKTI